MITRSQGKPATGSARGVSRGYYVDDGTFVNAEIIRRGYGHAYTRFPFRHIEAFREFEREARDNRRGLWGAAVGGSDPPD